MKSKRRKRHTKQSTRIHRYKKHHSLQSKGVRMGKTEKRKRVKRKKCKTKSKRDILGRGWGIVPDSARPFSEDPQPDITGITEMERYQNKLIKFHDNFLRTNMILWKKRQARLLRGYDQGAQEEEPEEEELGWEFVPDVAIPYNNYLKYLLDEMPENIELHPSDGWVRADKGGFTIEALTLLEELGEEPGTNFWIDQRLIDPESRWLGMFTRTSPNDKIIEMEPPGEPPD